MKGNKRTGSLYEREMQRPSFRRAFRKEWEKLRLEAQFLGALDGMGWTYEEFAGKIGTKRSHVSRDLKGGGLERATMARVRRMAKALDMDFVPLLIPKKQEAKILPELEKVVSHYSF